MSSRPAIALLLALLVAGCDRQTPGDGQANASASANAGEASPDEVQAAAPAAASRGGVDRSHKGVMAPASAFAAPDGSRTTLAKFRGRPVLVNLWATWCAPCVKELPSLDAAAMTLGDRVQVLAVSQDMEPQKVAPFLAARKIVRLTPYTDGEMALSLAYRANLPTTILLDARGREVWRVTGAMDWTGAEARKLIAEAG